MSDLMTWDDVLERWSTIEEVSRNWATRVDDASIAEDLAQELAIFCVTKLSLDGARDPQEYFRAALWKKCHKLLLNPRACMARETYHFSELAGRQLRDDGQLVANPDKDETID